MYWKKFQKYPNVYTTQKFIPFLGDVKDALDDHKAGRAFYSHRIKQAAPLKDYDMKVRIEGQMPLIMLHSNQAIEEFCKLQPHKIDRFDPKKGLNKLGKDTFLFKRSTKQTLKRKKLLTSFLSLNSSSRHIPCMVKFTKEVLESLGEGTTHDFVDVTNIISFNIFTSVLFGADMIALAEKKRSYKMPGGAVDHISLREFSIRLFKAHYAHLFHPLTITLKFLMTYNLVNPFKRDRENYLTYMEAMKELYLNCTEKESICQQILDRTDFTEFEKINDLNAFILAGAETSSHAMVSTLFFLKKYPRTLQKLMKEFEDNGITKQFVESQPLTKEIVESLDYLACVVKEALRMDNPASEPFNYFAVEDVNICGVPFPKGTIFRKDINAGHYNPNYWKDPYEFVPERFDVESEFFQEASKEGKIGAGYSKRSFSHGTRACPGQSFAVLEIKVVLIVVLTHIGYTVDDALLDKEGVGFGIGSECIPSFKVTKL
uniref:Cytochrome P450 n=2 Tax=Euplotes crassus TaxID=5936 RepID=A0A7S3NU63_EUPCR|mmetsp:Transcript_31621/g.31087  ORF Transcript_31621/g.31087 Transcript_31621/m.31087 type:complete len:487 (+) Transcript_31621:76-1536(+)